MKNVLTAMSMFGLVVSIFVVHIMVQYILPAPFTSINIIIIFLSWITFRYDTNQPAWFALVFGFLMELFSADHFGLVMISLMASVLILSWLLRVVFTNYSWYMILCASFLFVVIYQINLVISRIVVDLFLRLPIHLATIAIKEITLEALINAVIVMIMYMVAASTTKRHSPRYI